jgi:hypothetical protein
MALLPRPGCQIRQPGGHIVKRNLQKSMFLGVFEVAWSRGTHLVVSWSKPDVFEAIYKWFQFNTSHSNWGNPVWPMGYGVTRSGGTARRRDSLLGHPRRPPQRRPPKHGADFTFRHCLNFFNSAETAETAENLAECLSEL